MASFGAVELLEHPYLDRPLPRSRSGWKEQHNVDTPERAQRRAIATPVALVGAFAGVILLAIGSPIAAAVCAVALCISLGVLASSNPRTIRTWVVEDVPRAELESDYANAAAHAKWAAEMIARLPAFMLPAAITVAGYDASGSPYYPIIEVHLTGANGELAAAATARVTVAFYLSSKPVDSAAVAAVASDLTAEVETSIAKMRRELMIAC